MGRSQWGNGAMGLEAEIVVRRVVAHTERCIYGHDVGRHPGAESTRALRSIVPYVSHFVMIRNFQDSD